MTVKLLKKPSAVPALNYNDFDQLNGLHPWMNQMPEGFVAYRVREINKGKVTYFNYALAKEMGLIHPDHPTQMNSELEKTLIKTFSIQIINEYDELSKRRIDPTTIKTNKFMATRYLQLQHTNKQGKTSGDGRGIWNGTVKHRGKIWDVSSRGTGVTCLAPGSVEANRPLKTGATEFGYGCGQAEIDELYGAAIMAEVMHLQGIKTERVLCIIDYGDGYGVGVRAAPNLIRPAHMFLYLKQERYDELKRAADYTIDRQNRNSEWNIKSKTSSRYDEMAEQVCKDFAEFSAILDVDYVFAWLDWDGDNVLANAGIIDYGSIRQFGLRHDQYRYDDVQRFSTNLNEQKQKARLIVQVFVQMADYLKSKQKRPLKQFANHPIVKKFDRHFNFYRNNRVLYKMGLNPVQREKILKDHFATFRKFDREFKYFERAKASGGIEKVADGINRRALFNMRNIMRELPKFFLEQKKTADFTFMESEKFFKIILSKSAKSKDSKLQEAQAQRIKNFQKYYLELVSLATSRGLNSTLESILQKSDKLNREEVITGNALIQIVDEILVEIKKGLKPPQTQKLIDWIILSQHGLPEVNVSKFVSAHTELSVKKTLAKKFNLLVVENQEEI